MLDGQFVVAVAAYPFIMASTLAARQSWMSLVNPWPVAAGTPPGGTPMGPDLWVTNDPLTLATTCFAFAAVFVAHGILLGHLTMRRLPGAAQMGMRYSAASTLSLLLITVTYFLYYIRSSRLVLWLSGYKSSACNHIILSSLAYWLQIIPLCNQIVLVFSYGPKSAEWIIFAAATTLLAAYSLFTILVTQKVE